MKNDQEHGEVKTRKSIFPQDARDIVDKGTIGILISQCSVSEKTKKILSESDIVLYENVEAEEVDRIRETVKERLKEKRENEKGE